MSPRVIGDGFAARGAAARDEVVLATKVGARPLPGHADLDHVEGLSAPAVRKQLIASLRRLRADHVDLLYAHLDDTAVAFEETLGAFGELVEEGLVREVGASNLTGDRLREAVAAPEPHPYRALQQRFTYLPTAPGADTAPQVVFDPQTQQIAASADITAIGYSPLLSGVYTRTDRPVPDEYDTPSTSDRLRQLHAVAEDIDGLDAGQLVLAWMSQRPAAVLPIVGVSGPDQVRSAWQAVHHELPDDTLASLDAARA